MSAMGEAARPLGNSKALAKTDSGKKQRRKDATRALLKAAESMHMDGWGNSASGLGGKRGKQQCNTWVPRMPLQQTMLEDLYAQSALIARICDREPDDATREGFDVEGLSKADTDALDDWMMEHSALPSLADGRRWGNLFGGGAVWMQVDDGRKLHEPIDMRSIFAVNQLHPLERWDLVAEKWNLDPNTRGFGRPSLYRVVLGGASIPVHADRLLVFDGVRLPRQKRLANDGFGGSVIDQVWEQFEQWCITHAYLAESITQHSQGVLKLKGLANALKSGNSAKVRKRLQALMRGLSVVGDVVLDSDSEDYAVHTRSMTGFKEALEAFTTALVAVTPMPESILLGRVPGGLNSGEAAGDWKSWNTYVQAQQKLLFSPLVHRLLTLVFRSRMSPISELPDRIVIKWRPLVEPDPKDQAEIHSKNATARSADIMSRVIEPEEARRQTDVAEAYRLEPEEVEEAGDSEGDDPPAEPIDGPRPMRVVGS